MEIQFRHACLGKSPQSLFPVGGRSRIICMFGVQIPVTSPLDIPLTFFEILLCCCCSWCWKFDPWTILGMGQGSFHCAVLSLDLVAHDQNFFILFGNGTGKFPLCRSRSWCGSSWSNIWFCFCGNKTGEVSIVPFLLLMRVLIIKPLDCLGNRKCTES